MPALRLAMAQLNLVVGDLEVNVARIVETLGRAEAQGADLCLFPELAIPGYPPEDLLMKPRFLADNMAGVHQVAAASRRTVAVVGYVEVAEEPGTGWTGDGGGSKPPARLWNAAAVCANGSLVGSYHKHDLPNYGVFDEKRWFTPGTEPHALYDIAGVAVGISICEDVWSPDGPVVELGRGGADIVVNINASPFSHGRWGERLTMLRERVAQSGAALAYCNLVGGQDELVFDGASVVLGADGTLLAAARQFEEELVLVDVTTGSTNGSRRRLAVVPVTEPAEVREPLAAPTVHSPLAPAAEIYEALVLGTRDYLLKNGFTDGVIALSGGVDSALVATIATDALGPEQVHGLSMPSRYSSEGSIADALELAKRLGIDVRVVPIDSAHVTLTDVLTPVLGGPPSGLTDENLQSRLRGLLLMAVSNAKGWIVLTTGNKSEIATGYFTLYGDAVGGFAAIKDISKTQLYELCEYRNARPGPGPVDPIPRSILDKAPSAELRPDQRDDQSLPPYEVLDPVLEAYVERDRTKPEMVAEGFDPVVVDAVVRLVDTAEYKRRQLAPGVRITAKAFGKDRRVPITNRYRAEEAPAPEPGAGSSA
ncbi:MAG TPA: NAD+ synthase [Acidimicrobiales bacterium]|nr:NAD+ synthase [Acidimicrobiales bacterium]